MDGTLMLVLLLSAISSLAGSQSLEELQSDMFDVPLPGMEATKENQVQWSFRTPPVGTCIRNMTLVLIEGIGGQRMIFQWNCDVIILKILLDSSGHEDTIVYPLSGTKKEMMVTAVFQRYRRTLLLTIQGEGQVDGRLNGSKSEFLPRYAKLFHHPLVCMQSVTFNGLNLLGNTGYPSCNPKKYNVLPLREVPIYAGDVLNVSSVLHEFTNCRLSPVSQLLHGKVVEDSGILYKHDESLSSEVVFFYGLCMEDNSHNLITIEISSSLATLTADLKQMSVASLSTVVNSSYLNVTRTKKPYSLKYPMNFTVESYTTYGSLLLGGNALRPNDGFNQTALDLSLLVYRIVAGNQAFEEVVQITATSVGAPSLTVQLTIMYNPTLEVKLQALNVREGKTAILSKTVLNVSYGVSCAVDIYILVQPTHGKVIRPPSATPLDSFSGQDIVNQTLLYVHDDSETTFDTVAFGISPQTSHIIEKTAIMDIVVSLTNDNAPVRNSSAVISVVNGMNTFFNSEDISYIDADIDQAYRDITIEQQEVVCGEIVRQKWLAPMYRFTQYDVMSKQVVFHHFGENASCNLPVIVSDGFHALSEMVEIVPIEYQLEINGTLSMNVSRNGESILRKNILLIASNTKIPNSEIIIVVKRLPLHGVITSPNADRFTYDDVVQDRVTYNHLGTLSISDTFTLKIKIDGLVRNLVINVVIDTDANLLKPIVLNNFAIAGQVGTLVEINSKILSVHHQLALSSQLQYQVPNQFGQQALQFTVNKPNGSSVGRFTQEDINAGRVFYSLKETSRPSTLLVSFRGVSTDLVFTPILLEGYIRAEVEDNLTVIEGGVSAVQTQFISTPETQFSNELLSVVITNSPLGVSFYYNYTVETTMFTVDDITAGLISIRHDGSEISPLSLRCTLRYPNAESEEREITIHVLPENDHYPSFNVTGELQPPVIYIGETVTLTNRSLLIEDEDGDTSPSVLRYSLASPQQHGGRILKYTQPCVNFTQWDVNALNITFEHLGIDRTLGIRYLDMIISDGQFSRHSTLTVVFKERNVRDGVINTVYQVFPTIPHAIPYKHMPKQVSDIDAALPVRSEITFGSIRESQSMVAGFVQSQLVYVPSNGILQQLCDDIANSVCDKITLTTANDDNPSLVENAIFYVNISFLNVNSQSVKVFDIVTSELVIRGDEPVAVNSDIISAAGLAHHYSVCNSKIRLGFLVTHFPRDCTILGMESKFILWWDQILLSRYSVSCSNDITTVETVEQFVLNIAVQQNERLWVMEKFDYIVSIKMDFPLMSSEEKLTCSVHMLQGHNSVTLSEELVMCLGQEMGLDSLLAITKHPSFGDIILNGLRNLSFTLRDVTNRNVHYVQDKHSKLDSFELTQRPHMVSAARIFTIVINVQPNVVSNGAAVVIGHNPIVLTTDLLDASPLLELSQGEATYWVTRAPTLGILSRADRRKSRAVAEPLSQFTHTDVVNQLVLYYPPEFIPDKAEDNFMYTLVSPGVQSADGVFTVTFNQSNNSSTRSHTVLVDPGASNYAEPVITIIVVCTCVSICIVTILVTALCLRRVQRKRRKNLARQERINSEPRLILTRENGSYKLLVAGGDEFPVTPYVSPSSPLRQIDGERACEVSPTVPQVRVTPLIDKDGTVYDLHDYVNCEDLPCLTPRSSEERFSSNLSQEFGDEDTVYHSIEQLPHIKKPNYSC